MNDSNVTLCELLQECVNMSSCIYLQATLTMAL